MADKLLKRLYYLQANGASGIVDPAAWVARAEADVGNVVENVVEAPPAVVVNEVVNGGAKKRPAPLSAFDCGGPSSFKQLRRSGKHQRKQQQQVNKPETPQVPEAPLKEEDDDEEDNGGYNSEDEYSHLGQHLSEEEWQEKDRRFERLMKKKGLIIKRMVDDGSCLFRAVSDQVYGDQEMHPVLRRHCMNYIEQNVEYYSQYITEDFETYIARKRYLGVHGNHLEIQALSEMYNRPIHIYCYSAEPINIFQTYSKSDKTEVPIRLCYHRGVHYNSLVDPHMATVGVGLGLPGHVPGSADRNLMRQAVNASEQSLVEQAMLEDKIKATDWEATNEAIEEQVARESYNQWLRDNERRHQKQRRGLRVTATVTSGELRSPKASSSNDKDENGNRSPLQKSMNSPRAGCSSDRDSPKPCCSSSSSSHLAISSSNTDGASANPGGFNETDSFLNGLPPHMFGKLQNYT